VVTTDGGEGEIHMVRWMQSLSRERMKMITEEWLRETEMWMALYCAAAVFVSGWVLFYLSEMGGRNQ